ncbi:MAG: hypothetical protein EU539_04295 [Promethearchaeota archaeon]|nr:MAG: hypothetical protein EU539_04295 [Candidatus Lokiarchaeota archaeon]
MEIFLKRAEGPFIEKIGEDQTRSHFEDLKNALHLIPGEFSGSVGSEIPKFLFKYSQGINETSSGIIEGMLNHFLIFTKSLKDIANQNLKQVNQNIIIRSKSKMRNLSDLLQNFIEKAKYGEILKGSEKFEDVLSFVAGESIEITQMDELALFIKRSSENLAQRIGEDQARKFSEEIYDAIQDIVDDFKGTVDSQIVKFLFKFSQESSRLEPDIIKNILRHIQIFIRSLSDLGGMDRKQVDQEIIRRSKNKMGGLFELFDNFLKKAKEGNLLETCDNFEEIITFVLGSEEKRIQFTDVGGFLKRVEEKYALHLGELKAQMLISNLLESISEIPEQHGSYLGSDIARFLTKFSETMNDLEPKEIEQILTRSLIFIRSLNELSDLNQEEINQYIINRSKRKCRSLFEFYKLFLDTVRPTFIKSETPSFDDIINFTLGKYEGPKTIEEAPNVHALMEPYRSEFPFAEDHFKWANAINIIIPRFLEILKNDKGDEILDKIWENSYPKQDIIEEFHQKLDDLPREDEKIFTIRLMNLLTRQILKKKKSDKLLTGSVAMTILAKIYIEIYGGRNSMVRAIKLKQLLKERQFAQDEKREKINDHIEAIVKEDLKAIMRRVMSIRSIIPILTLKGFYIKTFDISEKEYPELFTDMFKDVSPLNDIGKEYLENVRRLNTLGNLSAFYYYIDLVRNFNKNYFKESEETPLDAIKKRDNLKEFFEMLFQLYDNLELSRFFDNKIAAADRLVFVYILKYLYESLKKTFDLIENFIEEHVEFIKVKSMEFFLSNLKFKEYKMNIEQLQEDVKNAVLEGASDDSEKMTRLKNMLKQQKSDIVKFTLMDDLLNEAKEKMPVLDSRILFGKELFTFLEIIKYINPNLPAALPKYLENLGDFTKEFDKILNKVKKLKDRNLISPGEFYEIDKAREMATERISKFISDENFMNHLKKMREGYDKNILYKEEITTPLDIVETEEIVEEINPLQKYFQKYNEALSAVKSTDTLTKFMESYQFWLNNQIFPLTYNKAEQVLLKIVFNRIQEELNDQDNSA